MYRVKYYYYLCKKRYTAAIKTGCGSSMGRLEGCGKKMKQNKLLTGYRVLLRQTSIIISY